jgi:uncharacterized protein YndB with AHSA1/START domain
LSHDLKVERVLEASPEDVFDAFTDPDAHKKMYADAPDWIVESECDLRVGGKWRISFGPSGGVPAPETNVFQMVDRSRRPRLPIDDDDAEMEPGSTRQWRSSSSGTTPGPANDHPEWFRNRQASRRDRARLVQHPLPRWSAS